MMPPQPGQPWQPGTQPAPQQLQPALNGQVDYAQLAYVVRGISREVYYPGIDESQLSDEGRAMLPALREQWDADLRKAVREDHLHQAVRRLRAEQAFRPPAVSGDLASQLASPRQTMPHRVTGLAGWAHNVLLSGPRKTGKSQLLVNLAGGFSCSGYDHGSGQWTAGSFLGSPCFASGNVAYLNGEMDADDLNDCFRALGLPPAAAARIFPLHLRGLSLPLLTSDPARDWFIRWLRGSGAEVLFIDTWRTLCAWSGIRRFNDDGETAAMTECLDEIKAEAGVQFTIISAHTPHQTGERHLERFKGAGALGDWADALWVYVKDDDGVRYLSATGRARIDMPESALAFNPFTGWLQWAGGSRAKRAMDTVRDKIIAVVGDNDGIKTEELLDAVGGNRSAARKTLTDLVASKAVVVSRKKGKDRSKYHYLPGRAPAGADEDGVVVPIRPDRP